MSEVATVDDVDYGPLAPLIGTWFGEKGLDIAPEPDGTEENPYYETIVFEAAGEVDNAEQQHIAFLRYHQVVRRKSNDEVFHDEVGFWMWDAGNKVLMHSLAIPRAVCVLAGGKHSGTTNAHGRMVLEVAAKLGDRDWGIVQSPFMRDNAKTTAFTHQIIIDGDTMSYREVTHLDIYGRTFEHVDTNTLSRHL